MIFEVKRTRPLTRFSFPRRRPLFRFLPPSDLRSRTSALAPIPSHVTSHKSLSFTLIELLVVMGIISILLVAVIPVVNSLSKSSGRKTAVSNLLGAIEQAHSQAIKDGQATYVVFPTFTSGSQATLDRYHYK